MEIIQKITIKNKNKNNLYNTRNINSNLSDYTFMASYYLN